MKRNNIVIVFLLLSALHGFSQDSTNSCFPEQKRFIDSVVLKGQQTYFRERTIAGIDSVIHAYRGSEGNKETSWETVKRFVAYDSILSIVKVIFE